MSKVAELFAVQVFVGLVAILLFRFMTKEAEILDQFVTVPASARVMPESCLHLLRVVLGKVVDAFDAEGVFAEFTAYKADEQAIEIPSNRCGGVEDAGTLIGIEKMGGIETDLGLAVEAFCRHDRHDQGCLDVFEADRRRKVVAVDVGTHRRFLGNT